MVTVKIIGAERVSRVLLNLGPKLNKAIDKTSGQFMKDVQKSAKLRAPKMTGELANSIKVKKNKTGWALNVDSPYGIFQEMGFRGHLVSSSASTRNSLGTIGAAYGLPGGVTMLIPAQKGKFFVRDALETNLAQLQGKLSNTVKGVIKA